MKTYLITENGDQLIMAKWEDKVKQLIKISKQINKDALEQSKLIDELKNQMDKEVWKINCSKK